MSCKCFKTISRPHVYIKSTRKGYKRITVFNNHFMAQSQPVEFQNKNRDLHHEISEAEFDAVWDCFTAQCTDIDIEASDSLFQAGNRIEGQVLDAKQMLNRVKAAGEIL